MALKSDHIEITDTMKQWFEHLKTVSWVIDTDSYAKAQGLAGALRTVVKEGVKVSAHSIEDSPMGVVRVEHEREKPWEFTCEDFQGRRVTIRSDASGLPCGVIVKV